VINGDQMNEKEVDIEINGEKKKVKIRALSWVEQNRIRDAVPKETLPDGRVAMKSGEFRIQYLIKSIVEATFDISIKGLEVLDAHNGEKLWDEVQKINILSDKKKEN